MKKMFILALVIAFAAACGGKKTKTTNTTNMGSASHGSGDHGSGDHGSGSGDHGSAAPAPTP